MIVDVFQVTLNQNMILQKQRMIVSRIHQDILSILMLVVKMDGVAWSVRMTNNANVQQDIMNANVAISKEISIQ